MPERRNGLYYESMDIRNHVLERNIGEYRGYRKSMLANGGLAIGMPYAVETELTPWTLAERSQDGLHLNLAFTKNMNPNINVAFREGGLFGYTHEVLNHPFDPLMRNYNIYESFFDYDSTEDVKYQLDKVYDSYPWGRSSDPWSERGLRPYSKHNQPQNAEYYETYLGYANAIFTEGLSFQKSLGQNYNGMLLNAGFNTDTTNDSVLKFIDERAGDIADDTEALKGREDTKMGYVGKILLDETKTKAVAHNDLVDTHPITTALKAYYGLSSLSMEMVKEARLGSAGVSYDMDTADSILGFDNRFMVEYDPYDTTDEYKESNPQINYLDNIHKKARLTQMFYRTAGLEYVNITKDDINGWFSVGAGVDNFGQRDTGYNGSESHHGDNLSTRVFESYDEKDENDGKEIKSHFDVESYGKETVSGINIADDPGNFMGRSLMQKTQELFRQHKIKTLVGRFHTSSDDDLDFTKKVGLTHSAVDATYGISHGRNLLKIKPTIENDYDNPYCRVWTYHHQYSRMNDLIRPFTDEHGNFMSIEDTQDSYPGRPILTDPARGSWSQKTVLNKNGMVNVAPTRKIGNDDMKRVQAKQCMFSIENLAWKGVLKSSDNIDEGEIGPLGGRIMWFPPYNLTFNENVSVSWGSNEFIGRGERVYTYTNTERTGTLSFTILADHPSILNYWLNSDNRRENPGTEEDQQKVLRFFAGCDNLEASQEVLDTTKYGTTTEYYALKENQKNSPKDGNDDTAIDPENTKEPEQTPGPPTEFTPENSIGFYVYFPNNLSGVDYMSSPFEIVNYLLRGVNGFDINPNVKSGGWSDKLTIHTDIDGFVGFGYEMGRSGGAGMTMEEKADEVISHNKQSSNDMGRNYMWGYGVDYDSRFKRNLERLCGPHSAKERGGDGSMKLYPENYVDKTDYALNARVNSHDEACGFSFLDVAAAISSSPYRYSGYGDPGRVAKIREILGLDDSKVRNGGGRKYYFGIAGGASVHGTKNVSLSQQRANFIKAWLEDCFKKLNLQVDYDEMAKIQVRTGIEGGEDALDINSESAKRGRYAKAVIYWNDEDVKDATDADVEYVEEDQPSGVYKEQVQDDDTDNITKEQAAESPEYLETVALKNASPTRYRDEEMFFDMLEERSPVVFKNIVDKVKYFDPIFHSITPEGFNARLAFLQQCTRQGPTMSSSDLTNNRGINEAGYAGNLSFGRAPVCVLRLGDFYNTRIIINSLSIQPETAQWDLNPEGIGVQPMLANVTIGFVFQGGSSLGGPIQRLQNALSFNYYANQEVYDNRADVAVYKDHEFDPDSSLIWLPGYGTTEVGSIQKAIDVKAPPQGTTVENIAEEEHLKSLVEQQRKRVEGKETVGKASQTEEEETP